MPPRHAYDKVEPGNPGGGGFGRLHEWGARRGNAPAGRAGRGLFDEINVTGEVLVGLLRQPEAPPVRRRPSTGEPSSRPFQPPH
jgi:hypothetical protein